MSTGNVGMCRPTLLLQETQSLACTLRILFKMSADESRSEDWTQIHNELTSVCKEALTYFLTLQREEHLEAWTCLLLLMITRIYKMPNDKVSWLYVMVYGRKVEISGQSTSTIYHHFLNCHSYCVSVRKGNFHSIPSGLLS